MAGQKGGRKLRRGPIKASYYKAQFARTTRNKMAAKERIARRKRDNPNLRRARILAVKEPSQVPPLEP